MIIISIGCGLGNQMFEYAFYYKLRKIYPNSIIKLDTKYAFPLAHNGIEVENIFGLQSEKANLKEVKSLIDKRIVGERENIVITLIRELRKRMGFMKKSYIRQTDFTQYDEKFFNLDSRNSYYLLSVFANSLYFHDIEHEIQHLFTFPLLDDENRKWLDLINNNISVSIHIRRGDYLKLNMGNVPLDYYKKAVTYLKNELKREKIVFLAFSDDVEFVRENFNWIENLYIVEGNTGENSFRDMQLMSLCMHNINANSTFSFWGAYLNKNPNKIVITPRQPINRCKYPFTCEGWIMM